MGRTAKLKWTKVGYTVVSLSVEDVLQVKSQVQRVSLTAEIREVVEDKTLAEASHVSPSWEVQPVSHTAEIREAMEDKTLARSINSGRSSQSLTRLRLERLWRTRLWPEASTVSPSWEVQPVSQTAEIREALGQDSGQKHQLCPLAGRSSQSLTRLRLERLWRTRLWPEASTVSPSWEVQPVSHTAEIREAMEDKTLARSTNCVP
ncbi:hypothetical protein RRG08_014848 [Elysia crispata]|uniref:Uncharacterized protein n=1 Tax=Elysia crispata TaxID=231223 RepID=A0AAE0Z5L7_9GAST|nr:hypothetical protein RRG08_014848 [Elysia crispata]